MNYRLITLNLTCFLFTLHLLGQELKGKVIDNQGELMPYVSISVGDKVVATTDRKGAFIMEDLSYGSFVLKASLMGYRDFQKKIELTEKRPSLELNIVLEEDAQALDEIVLTGVTRETSIRENPISVKSISSQELEFTSKSNIVDVLVQHTPGMNAVKTGPNISKPYIRGLGYNRVLTMYDGIRQEGQQWGDEHGLEMDPYHTDRAEVIKGPSSLMFGSDAIAGVVSFFPHLPTRVDGQLHGKLTSEFQTNNGLIGEGLIIDYNDQKYLFSATGSYRMANNYRNPVDGRVYQSNFKEKNFSTLLGYKGTSGTTYLKFTLFDTEQAIPEGDRDVEGGTRRFTKEYFGWDNGLYGEFIPVTRNELSTYNLPDVHQHIQHYRAYLKGNYGFGGGDINVILAGSQNIRTEFDNPETPGTAAMKVRLNTLDYAVRYDAPKFADIEMAVGLNGMLQNNKSIDASDFPIPDYDLYEGGAFVYAKWKRAHWTLSGGARYDLRQVKWGDFWIDKHPVTGYDEHIAHPRSEDSELLYENTKRDFNGFTASIGATFQLDDQFSLKANFGRAYRSPNITELAANDLDPGASIIYRGNSDFKAEFSHQVDFGFSGKYTNFSFDISAFHNNIQNFIYLSRGIDDNGEPIMDENGNREYWYQQAAAKLYGGELWFAIHPRNLQNLRWDNSFSYVRGLNRDKILKNEGRNGYYLPDVPPFKWISTLTYTFPIHSKVISDIKPNLGWEVSAAQNEYFGRNETESKTPGYVLFNAGLHTKISYHPDKQPVQFSFAVTNLFDKAYQDHLSRLKYMDTYLDEGIGSPNGRYGIYDMGRNISFKAIFPF